MKIICIFILLTSSLHASNDFNLDFSLNRGQSDNLAKDKSEKLHGKYVLLDIKTKGSKRIGRYHQVYYHLDINTMKYDNQLYADNFNSSLFTAELGNQFVFFKNHLLGFQLYNLKYSGRTTDFETSSVSGRESRYSEVGASFSYEKTLLGIDIKSSTFVLQRDFTTLSNDENGNTFEDDYNAIGLNIGFRANVLTRVSLAITPRFEIKKYDFRRSRFTEGTIDNSKSNPLQKIANWSLTNALTYTGDFLSGTLTYSASLQDDRILGALDYVGNDLALSITMPFGPIVKFQPSISFGNKRYQSFVADMINNPQATEKRFDEQFNFRLPIEISLGKTTVALEYEQNEVESNYLLEGYQEERMGIGFKYAFL